ncbi:PRC-barrel domain containing protein [Diaminobutyricibacter tongyongensis]|uniref:PRC-barrel domain containing protein n=1 Tax=Leifsonia tongyongensis TaxID=1268043 RepID=A0A6L9XWS8_9MICO|nr:PRC-barrel domain containing protein [Diaminobutyricibacter tongyongensis]
MATYNPNELVLLSKSDEITLDVDADIRGRKVVSSAGDELGTVHDLLVDQTTNRVRALVVNHGHLFSKTTSAIPVEAVTKITADEVVIDQNKDKVGDAPAYDPTLIYDEDYFVDVYDYYGYTPFWYDEYVYPTYPIYV